MRLEATIDISAPSTKVWAVLAGVENWPEWTKSMRKVERLEGGPFGLGSRVRISQPGFPPVVWTVTEFEPGSGFVWEAKSVGMRTVAGHRVEARDGGSLVTLSVEQTGLLAGIFGLMYGAKSRRYVEMEAEGLKRAAEGD